MVYQQNRGSFLHETSLDGFEHHFRFILHPPHLRPPDLARWVNFHDLLFGFEGVQYNLKGKASLQGSANYQNYLCLFDKLSDGLTAVYGLIVGLIEEHDVWSQGRFAFGTKDSFAVIQNRHVFLIGLRAEMLGLLGAFITTNLKDVAVDLIDGVGFEVFVVLLAGFLCFDVEVIDILSHYAHLLAPPCEFLQDIIEGCVSFIQFGLRLDVIEVVKPLPSDFRFFFVEAVSEDSLGIHHFRLFSCSDLHFFLLPEAIRPSEGRNAAGCRHSCASQYQNLLFILQHICHSFAVCSIGFETGLGYIEKWIFCHTLHSSID